MCKFFLSREFYAGFIRKKTSCFFPSSPLLAIDSTGSGLESTLSRRFRSIEASCAENDRGATTSPPFSPRGVGKTSMIYQLNMKQFKMNVTPTIGASFSCKVIDVDSYTVRFQIWDTAGQETYKSMLPMYYRKANLAMAVFDITCYDSFMSLPKWIEELKKTADKECVICVIGNKCDLDQKRVVDRIKASQFSKSIGALYFETSAKTSEGIMDAFIHIARQMINTYKRRRLSTLSSLSSDQSEILTLQQQSSEEQKSSSCCS